MGKSVGEKCVLLLDNVVFQGNTIDMWKCNYWHLRCDGGVQLFIKINTHRGVSTIFFCVE